MPITRVRLNLDALNYLVMSLGYDAAKLAADCDPPLDRSTVANILAGRRGCSASTVKRMTAAMKVPVSAVLADPEAEAS